MADTQRVLVVAHRTAATAELADAVARRAARGRCSFTLLVPLVPHGLHWAVDPEDQCCEEVEELIAEARPALEAAAVGRVPALIGSHDPLAAVEDALNLHGFDEVIVSTLPGRASRWLRMDLPARVARLGVPVTTVRTRRRRTHKGRSRVTARGQISKGMT
jgi:hypothetical protein